MGRQKALNLVISISLFISTQGCLTIEDSHYDEGLGALAESGLDKDDPATESAARIWNTTSGLSRCRSWSMDEDYSSGRYNVHRYATTIPADGTVTIELRRYSGLWSPAVVIFDSENQAIYEGSLAGSHPEVTSVAIETGTNGERASVELEASSTLLVNVYVTSWEALRDGFEQDIPRDARYELSMDHECDPLTASDLEAIHAGITDGEVSIPREGLSNGTLRGVFGIATEPHGDVVTYMDNQYVSGLVSWFGGPNDSGVSSSETGSISGERLRSLNTPLAPTTTDLLERPEDFYYAAMRFDYGPAGIGYWREARLLVVNPRTGDAIVVRPVDWGPNPRTDRIIDLSPQAMADLGIVTDDEVLVAFGRSETPLGLH